MKRLFKKYINTWEKKEMLCRLVMTFFLCIFTVIMTEVLVKGDPMIEAFNEQGESIDCSTDYYVTVSPVEFIYAKSLEVGECLGVKCSFDGGKSFEDIIKLPGNEYVFYPRNMNEKVIISFLSMDIATGTNLLLGNQYIYTGISNADLLSEFVCNKYKEDKEILYLNGDAPILTVNKADGLKTFLSVIQDDEESVYEVESELSVEFAQGEYVVKLYTQDLSGNINICKNFPMHFIYDITPPENIDLYIYGDYRRFNDNNSLILSDKALKVACDVQEGLSGIERIVFYKNDIEVDTPLLELPCGFEGKVKVKAYDRCGNESAVVECNESFIIEKTSPAITFNERETESEIVLDVMVTDEDSGILEASAYIDGKVADQIHNSQMSNECHLSLYVSKQEIMSKNLGIEVYATDFAGNNTKTVYDMEYLDDNAPAISIKGVTNAKAYASDVSINVSVKDDNIYDDEIEMTSSFKNLDGRIINKRYHQGDSLYFSEEGEYEFKVSAIDEKGNSTQESKRFRIDKSAPIINGLDMFAGKYLPLFSIKDIIGEMFEDESIVEYKLYLNGESFDPDETITKEGHYNLKVIATDEARNCTTATAEFVVYNADDNNSSSVSGGNVSKVNNKSNIIIGNKNYVQNEQPVEVTEKMDTNAADLKGIHRGLILLYLSIFSLCVLALFIFITIFRKKAGKDNGEKNQQRD